jgi:hypothetical protein
VLSGGDGKDRPRIVTRGSQVAPWKRAGDAVPLFQLPGEQFGQSRGSSRVWRLKVTETFVPRFSSSLNWTAAAASAASASGASTVPRIALGPQQDHAPAAAHSLGELPEGVLGRAAAGRHAPDNMDVGGAGRIVTRKFSPNAFRGAMDDLARATSLRRKSWRASRSRAPGRRQRRSTRPWRRS